YLLAPRLRRLSAQQGDLTLPDFLAGRTRSGKDAVRAVAAMIIFLCMMGYVAAQFTASGKALKAVFGIDYRTGVLIGALVTIFYTLMGGFRAVCWTDVIQASLMVFGLVCMPFVVIWHIGGFAEFFHRASAIPHFTDVFGGKQAAAALGMVVGLLGIGLGYPGQPHILARYMAIRSGGEVRRGRVVAITWGVLAFYGAVMLGHAVRILMPDLADAEYAFPKAAAALLHPALAGLMLAAIVSAIMSTADSQLLVAASSVARDFIDRILFRGRLKDESLVLISRAVVVVLGVLSILFALSNVRVVFWFVLYAWSGLGASFGPPVLIALFRKRPLPLAATIGGMLAGFATTIVWKNIPALSGALYELVPAFCASWLATHALALIIDSRDRAAR
ncbi:MAG TPA: sodium/proline symporter, partial [Proteobacteria bacterium]|nr:sodium/proline symporter [Pseudomonadota bacterium]